MYKQVISKHIVEYLKKVKYNHTNRGNLLLDCPYCKQPPLTANLIPNTSILKCLKCNKTFSIIDLYKIVENKPDLTEEQVLHSIKELLKLDIKTETDNSNLESILKFYQLQGFDFVPVAQNSKIPVEKGWTVKNHKNIEEIKDWVVNGNLNLGVKTGKMSNITVLDLDVLTKEEKKEFDDNATIKTRKDELLVKRKATLEKVLTKISELAGENIATTLIQDTLGGQHLVFHYEEELPKTGLKLEGVGIDLENDKGYILVAPSKVHDYTRTWNYYKIAKMPTKLLEYLKANGKPIKKTNSEAIKETIKTENLKINPKDFKLKDNGLQGTCNSSFIALGGILRKQLNIKDTEFVLNLFNNSLLEDPMESQAIQAMVQQLDYYIEFDEEDLSKEIFKHVKDVEKITKSDLELSIAGEWTKGEAKKRFNKALKYLIKEEKIKQYKNTIELVEDLEWSKDLINVGVPVDFKVPFVNDYAYFNWGDIIIIASKTGYGKTHLAMNIVKRLVDQGVHPYYVYSETGGRFAKNALKLGIRPEQFSHAPLFNPSKFRLPKRFNKPIIIYDWFRPKDFAKTDELFERLLEKNKNVNGFMIIFMQLKANDEYFAPNLLEQFPALACKYLYEDGNDGIHTKFEVTKVREGKMQGHSFKIPCVYDWNSKEVKMVEELTEDDKKKFVRKVDVNKLPAKEYKCTDCGKALKDDKYKKCFNCNQKVK